MRKVASVSGFLLCLLFSLPALCLAFTRTLYVNNTDPACRGSSPCYRSIQAAVNAAVQGNIVQIQAGTYAEQLTIDGKNNFAGATEAARIVIQADPALPAGSVTLHPPAASCLNGQGILIRRSKFVTVRGLTITGATGAGIVLLGGLQQNQAIHIERSRIVGNSSVNCPVGGITIALGNPDTLIANALIYGNGGNGISFVDSSGGPHWLIQNTIHGNAWNGVSILLGNTVTLANNLITGNGQATGALGGRQGVVRAGLPGQNAGTVLLLSNLICGNRLGEIQGPLLDTSDSGNLTPLGNEGPGVDASQNCDVPANVYADVNGPDGVPNTADDNFALADGSPAIDRGIDTRALSIDILFDSVLEADYEEDAAVRPQDGNHDGVSTFDMGAMEFPGDFVPPQIVFVSPGENTFVRQTITVTAEAADNIGVIRFTVGAEGQTLPASISPPLPTLSTTASALWNTSTFNDGAVALVATASDGSGNSASATRFVTVDNTPPDTQITGGPSGQMTQTSATFTFTGTDNLTPVASLVFAWRIDGGGYSPFTSDTHITINDLSAGSHIFEVIARDLAGNEDPTHASRTFTIQLGPTVSAIEPESGTIGTLVSITGTDFEPGMTQVTFNGATAVIRAITSTSIITTIPIDATTGSLTITNSRGSTSREFTVSMSQDFTVSLRPTSMQTTQGGSIAALLDCASTSGFGGLIQLATGSLPPGVTASFSPSHLAPTGHSLLTLSTSSSTSIGSYVIEIRATSVIDARTVTRTTSATLTVTTSGQTLLVGQVFDGDDRPLSGVSIKLGGATLTNLGSSDAAGNLFIPLSVTGLQVFLIDGSTANTAITNYPTIPVTFNVQPGVINELGYVPRLHGQSVANLIPIVPGQASVITVPDLPGFKMTIPVGVQIIGWDGQPNTQFSVTAVPIDRSPLPPLPPGLEARQTYLFSFGKVGGGVPTGNIPIDTANDVGGFPGETIDLYYFNEAPDGTAPNQWEKYGTGTVSSDGTTIVTDINPSTGLPYGIPRFCCGARTNVRPPNFPTPGGGRSGGPRDGGKRAGEPVDSATGFFYVEKTDMVLAGRVPIAIARTYRTNLNNQGPFGVGTSWPFDVTLASPPNATGDALILVSPGNRQDYFSRQSFTTFANTTSPSLRGAVLAVDRLTLTFKDGSAWQFDSLGRLQSQSDRNGNTIQLSRDSEGRVVSIGLFNGGELTINYTGAGIESITDAIGRQVRYTYDSLGRLETVTDPAGGITRYTYDSAHRMLTLTDPRGITFLVNEYDSEGRVARQTQADGGVWTFAYTSTGNYISETSLTNPRGNATTYRFNAAGYQISDTDALGQTTTFDRQSGSNLVLAITDALRRATRFEYDAAGNVTRITDPANNARSFTYDQRFSNVTSITDPLGNVSRFEYDNQGNLTAAVDPLGNRTTIAYNVYGEPTSRTDPLGNVSTFTYDAFGRLTDATDPLGNRTQRSYDAVFRLTSQTDPRGKVTKFAYDGLNRITQVVDALKGVTSFTYDGNGNLLTVTDARENTTRYSYDNMGRLAARTDPVGASESFQYDFLNNLIRHIDRKGHQSLFSYDPVNRQIAGSYSDGAYTSFVYDAVNRLVEVADSAGGVIVNQYDSLDRLAAEMTNLGTITYEYDSIGRRTRTDAPGQSPVVYNYDAASRLRHVLQETQAVDITYDPLGRRIQLTLPNGVSTEYQYDAASRLTALIYRNLLGFLGNLTYEYDRAGNRIGVGGSFARTLLPEPVDSATYDAANRQLMFGDKAMTFDGNGNLASITEASGVTTYSWDTRNRLIGITEPGLDATFEYDHSTRRIKKTTNGETTDYIYDGLNSTQELSQGRVSANSLIGLSLDEHFVRTDMNNGVNSNPLRDGLGSTVALTDFAGAIQTEYTYGPFGTTVMNGVSTATPFQYTGRENDSTGLYYYRSRYYSPALQRFVSEDPVLNFGQRDVPYMLPGLIQEPLSLQPYSYVNNSPVVFVDPVGLRPGGRSRGATGTWDSAASGNTWSGYTPQDWVCSDPAGSLNRWSCTKECCFDHDGCYEQMGCNASSWIGNFTGRNKPCQMCNAVAVICMIGNWGKDECQGAQCARNR
jgi:RHS repeat-associated protein